MPSVLVHHDYPIAASLADARPEMTVLAAESPDDVRENLPAADVFITNPAGWRDDYIAGLRAGNWVQATSAGYAAFPVETFRENGIAFTNAAGNYDATVTEHVFAFAFAFSRGLPGFIRRQPDREWDRSPGERLTDRTGQTMTIVGLGSIGSTVAQRALAFGIDVYGIKRNPLDYEGPLSNDRILPPDSLPAVLGETDILVLTVPLTDETRGMIDKQVFETLPNSAVLINVARGPVVVESALVDALQSGEIGGAGLDVFEEEPLPESSPLWDFDNTIITPHVGGRSDSFVHRFTTLFLDNFDRFTAGEPLRNTIIPGDR